MAGFSTMDDGLPRRSRSPPTQDRPAGFDPRNDEPELPACDPHAFPTDPADVEILATYGDGLELEATCPRCGATLTGEVLTGDLEVVDEGGRR